MKKINIILLVLIIVSFVIRSIFLFGSPLKIWDETIYANLGYDLSHDPLDYSLQNKGWSDFIPSGQDNFYAWPKIGFRAPLLPYLISIFYFLKLDFFVDFLIPLIGTLSIILVYLLGRELFNERVGLISSLLFAIVPLHVFYSGRLLTGVLCTFFVLLTFLSFWKGYEKNDKKHKILFGFFLALSILSRYTALWFIPIFLLYFLARNKSLKFLNDKYLLYSFFVFFITLLPWFVYGIFVYNNPIGTFIHGIKASTYWGGVQSWHFFFDYWWQMFSIIGFVFIIALLYILYRKEFMKREIYLLLIWFIFFLGMAIYMPHKEDRYILPIVPTITLVSGYLIGSMKKYEKIILAGIIIISLISILNYFLVFYNNSYTDTNICFLEGNMFLGNQENALIISDEPTIVYYYTKQTTHFYPNPWNYSSLESLVKNYSDKNVFVFFSDFDMPLNNEKNIKIKEDLDRNLKKIFECSKENAYSAVYMFE